MTHDELTRRLALVVITDAECGSGRSITDVVRAALRGGAPAIQLRDKSGTAREMFELATALRAETAAAGALFFVNDRVDVAIAAEADGVHVGDDDLPVEAIRRFAPPGFLIGRSVDDPSEAIAAREAGADYVGVGPVLDTPSKTDAAPAIGTEGIARVAKAAALPVVAIGGIDAGNAEEIAAAGAHGVAVIRAVIRASDPGHAAAELVAAVRRGRN